MDLVDEEGEGKGKRVWGGVWILYKRRKRGDVGYMEEDKEENCEGGIHGIRTTVTEKTILGGKN